MKRKKNVLSSIRLLLVSLLLICFLPFNLSFSDSGVRLETGSVIRKANESDSKNNGLQENALPLTDLDPDFKATITNRSFTDTCQSFSLTFSTATSEFDYTFGYYGDGALDLPLILQYDVLLADGSTETRSLEIANSNRNGNYQPLGVSFSPRLPMTVDILLTPGETVVQDSLLFFNIFTIAKSTVFDPSTNTYPYVPGEQPYFVDEFVYDDFAETNVDLTQYIDVKLDNISTFLNYASITATIYNNSSPLYEEQMIGTPGFGTNQDRLESGDFRYDYQFANLMNSYFIFYYEDGEQLNIPLLNNSLNTSFRINEGNTTIHLLVQDIDFNGLTGVSLCATNFNIGIVNKKSLADINNATFSVRLGSLYFNLREGQTSIYYINIGMILLITLLCFSAVYILGIVGAYFFFKNKYKNDEFKRVNTKQFFKINILGYLAVTVILMDIMIICFRACLLGSELAMYNPLDNYIVCLSIIGILFIGYFIKYFVTNIKAYLERRAINKLQLDKDKADDGTN